MRRAAIFSMLLFVALPGSAWALRLAPGEGTLSVKNGDGVLTAAMTRGAAIGKIGQGQLRVEIAESASCEDLQVFGAERGPRERPVSRGGFTMCVFGGRDIRFRLVGQELRFWIGNATTDATSFSLSMVARGGVFIRGAGGPNDGTYSVNGEEYVTLPDEGRRWFLGAAQTVSP